MGTVKFSARLSSLAVVEVKGSQVLKVPLALPHNLEVLAGLAALLGQEVAVTIAPLQLTFADASDSGVMVHASTWVDRVTGEVRPITAGEIAQMQTEETMR